MGLTSRKTIRELLRGIGAKPSKRFGQNFLIDKNAVEKIIQTAELKNTDIVLEIGPGLGVITQELAKRAKKVIAVEKDRKMVEVLKETLKDYKNVEILNADIRKSDFPKTPGVNGKTPGVEAGKSDFLNFKVVGNLPFYLTAPVIRKFLEADIQPELMVLMVQKEVAQRICEKPPRMNLLAVSVQIYADVEIISYVSKKSFWPQPQVDAAIMKIIPRRQTMGEQEKELFFKIVKAGFSQPRKQLINNLSKQLQLDKGQIKEWLNKNGINAEQRAETISIDDWINLTKSFKIN